MPTFHFRLVQRVHVAVHGERSPTSDEWIAYLDDIGARIERIDALYVLTYGGNLTGEQRQQSVEFWRRSAKQPRIAIVTPSRMVVRVSGALRWFMPSQIKAFLPRQTEEAFEYLELDDGQRRAVTSCVEELTRLVAPTSAEPASR